MFVNCTVTYLISSFSLAVRCEPFSYKLRKVISLLLLKIKPQIYLILRSSIKHHQSTCTEKSRKYAHKKRQHKKRKYVHQKFNKTPPFSWTYILNNLSIELETAYLWKFKQEISNPTKSKKRGHRTIITGNSSRLFKYTCISHWQIKINNQYRIKLQDFPESLIWKGTTIVKHSIKICELRVAPLILSTADHVTMAHITFSQP